MQVPPNDPNQQYAAYPRQTIGYGSAAHLRSLWEGYSGLNLVFVVNIVLAVGINIGIRTAASPATFLIMWAGAVTVLFLVIAGATYPYNKKIAFGANWQPAMAVVASVLMGLNSALCCGIIGYVVMQQLALAEMKKYGLKISGLGGVKKRELQAAIAQLESQLPAAPLG